MSIPLRPTLFVALLAVSLSARADDWSGFVSGVFAVISVSWLAIEFGLMVWHLKLTVASSPWSQRIMVCLSVPGVLWCLVALHCLADLLQARQFNGIVAGILALGIGLHALHVHIYFRLRRADTSAPLISTDPTVAGTEPKP